METFGIVDILQKRLQAWLPPPQKFGTGADTLLPTESVLRKRSREHVLDWLAMGRHTDVGPDIKEALHIGIAAVLLPSVGVTDQPDWYLALLLMPSKAA